MNITPTINQTLDPYYQFSKNATQNKKLSQLIDDLTDNAGNKEPSSSGTAYLVDKTVQFFSREFVQNGVLNNLKDQALADKYSIHHQLNSENIPEHNQKAFLKVFDNHITTLTDLINVNSGIVCSKVFYATALGLASLASFAAPGRDGKAFLLATTLFTTNMGTVLYLVGSSQKNSSDYDTSSSWDANPMTLKDRLFENLTICTKLQDPS